MADKPTPYWVLISVLFSSLPISPAVGTALHEAALELWRNDGAVGEVAGDLVRGRVVNLRKELLLGAIAGPAFEAEIDTERGTGKVRFLLTRQGLELLGAKERKPAREWMH